jgi:DNA-binding transcriptional ArsR family regulator
MVNQSLDAVFQALADPTRRMMLEPLARGPASVGKLARPFAMSLPAVMQHLAILDKSKLVRSTKVGRVRTCQMNSKTLSRAERWINQRRNASTRSFGSLYRKPRRPMEATKARGGEQDAALQAPAVRLSRTFARRAKPFSMHGARLDISGNGSPQRASPHLM